MQETTGISIRDLTVRAGGRLLLDRASAEFPGGKVTLVIGASGAGKTVLMKLLAGLIRPGEGRFEAGGDIRIGGEEVLRGGRPVARGRRSPVGIVFQNAALFDELSAVDNLRFARDHRPRERKPAAPAEAEPREPGPSELLAELGVPSAVPISAMSGGQRQRAALARTLAYDPPVIIYDEPTSGLDPVNARRVAERIERTGAAHRKTSIVVTHDFEHLAAIAAEIWLLDPEAKRLVRLEPGDLAGLATSLPGASGDEEAGGTRERTRGIRAPARIAAVLERSGELVESIARSVVGLVPAWRSVRWGLRYFRHYLGLVASLSAWLYFGAAGLIAGFVSTYFVFRFLPEKKYTEPLFSEDILGGLGFVLYRVLVPVLVTVLMAARCGAAVASDVGNRVYSNQVDAMRSMGARPGRYLLTGILWAFLVGAPFLGGIGFLAGRTTSLVVYVHQHPERTAEYWDSSFHRELRMPGETLWRGSDWLLAKLLICGFGVGAIAYHFGIREKVSGVEVSRGVNTTIVVATLYVLVVHLVVALLEF